MDDDKEKSNDNKNDDDENESMNPTNHQKDDDLEDGEIETDDDDDEPIIVSGVTASSNTNKNQTKISNTKLNANNPSSSSSMKLIDKSDDTAIKQKNTTAAGNMNNSSSISSKMNTEINLTSNDKLINTNKSATDVPITTTNKKSSKSKFVEDDWAENIENAIATALKKEGVILPKQNERERERDYDGGNMSDDDDNVRSRNSSKGTKKRKRRESDKKSKKKMKQHHDDIMSQNDEIDDYEMLCIRGGSPPPLSAPLPTSQIHRHHHHHSHPAPSSSQYYDSDNSYTSYDSYDSQEYKSSSYQDRQQTRKMKDRRRKGGNDRDDNRKRGNDKRKRNDDRDDGGVCIPNIRGYCYNGDECTRSHDWRGQRKLELCKFYLMECCAKKDKCSYMHSDFPCKYYYLGMECIYKGGCKFSHGKPLTEQLRNILLKHIETAPKEILGNFRRISREHAITLLNATHAKLCAEQGIENTLAQLTSTTSSIVTVNSNMNKPLNMGDQQQPQSSSSIPSLLDIVIKPPIPSLHKDDKLSAISKSEKQRKSRWCDTSGDGIPSISANTNHSLNSNTTGGLTSIPSRSPINASVPDVLSLKNLSGVITAEQIEKLAAMGIENLEQVNQLTVAQLNNLGLTINQINEIQLNALNIQKLGLIKSPGSSSPPSTGNTTSAVASSPNYLGNLVTSSSVISSSGLSTRQSGSTVEFVNPGGLYSDPSSVLENQKNPTQDIDMRFIIGGATSTEKYGNRSPSPKINLIGTGIASPDAIQPARTMNDAIDISSASVNSSTTIDYSQYLKDSNLDAEKTDLNDISLDKDDGLNEDEPELLIDESWMDPNDEEKDSNLCNDNQNGDNDDNDENDKMKSVGGRLSSPDNIFAYNKKSSSYYRDSDEENWDTDEENESSSKKSKRKTDSIPLSMNDTENGNNVSELREFRDPRLHKTQLQSTTTNISNSFSDYLNTPSTSFATIGSGGNDSIFDRYGSNNDNVLNDNWLTTTITSANTVNFDNETSNGTGNGMSRYKRSSIYDGNPKDMDDDNTTTRKKCDKDMRMSSFIDSSNSDIDLRLPFKPVMTNYTPATEIDGSISSHSPIPYKVVEIEIPKPDYSEIRRNIPVSEKTLDPRLRRIFCLKESTSNINELGGLQSDMQFSCTNRNASNINASSLLQKHDDLNEKQMNSGNNNSGSNIGSGVGGAIVAGPRADPRRRKESQDNILGGGSSNSGSTGDKNQGVDIRLILQKSNWYKNLNSKFKIMVNQQLALVSTELKKFHQDTSPNKVFDMSFIAMNTYLQQILTNLCIYIDSNGQIRQLEGDNDGDGTSSMPGMMGLGGISGMDPTVAASSVQQMTNAGGGLVMQSTLNGPAQLSSMLSAMPGAAAAAAGMYMRGAPPLNMAHGGGTGTGLMSQFRPQRYDNIRPGLLGIAPGIQYNPFDSSVGNEMSDMTSGYMGGQTDDQNNFNAFSAGGGGSGSDGIVSLFDQQNNFFGRSGDGNLPPQNNRGMRNNFRQGGGGGGGSGGGRNQSDRWNTGGSGNGGSNRDGNSRRNFDGGKNNSRREKSQKFERRQNK